MKQALRACFITPSEASEAAQHEADHREVDPGLAGGAEPLVILAEPPIMRKPGERALHHPPPRDDMETRFRQVFRPIDLLGRDVVGDPVALEAMDRLDRLHAPASNLLDPV